MKKTAFYLCLAVMMVTTFTRCSKDDPDPIPTVVDFIPLTEGTNWTYVSTEGTAAPITYKLTVTNKDTTAILKTYKVITNSASANNYMANIGTEHYRLANFDSLGISSFEDPFLKEDKAVNETWTSTANFTYTGNPLSAALNYTVKEKGASRTVAGKNYTDVTHVRLDISILLLGDVGGGDFYYAKGIGMVESIIAITPPAIFGVDSYNLTQQLTAYEIK